MRNTKITSVVLGCTVLAWPVQACLATPFTNNEIVFHFGGNTILGYSRRSGALWREFLALNGETLFQIDGGDTQEGRWKINDGTLCFSYGTFSEWSCKVVLEVSSCSIWNGVYLTESYVPSGGEGGTIFDRAGLTNESFTYTSKIIEVLPSRALEEP